MKLVKGCKNLSSKQRNFSYKIIKSFKSTYPNSKNLKTKEEMINFIHQTSLIWLENVFKGI